MSASVSRRKPGRSASACSTPCCTAHNLPDHPGGRGLPAITVTRSTSVPAARHAASAVPSVLLSSTTKMCRETSVSTAALSFSPDSGDSVGAPYLCLSSEVTARPMTSASLRAGMTTATVRVVAAFPARAAETAGTSASRARGRGIRQNRPRASKRKTQVAMHTQPAIRAAEDIRSSRVHEQDWRTGAWNGMLYTQRGRCRR